MELTLVKLVISFDTSFWVGIDNPGGFIYLISLVKYRWVLLKLTDIP